MGCIWQWDWLGPSLGTNEIQFTVQDGLLSSLARDTAMKQQCRRWTITAAVKEAQSWLGPRALCDYCRRCALLIEQTQLHFPFH